MASPKSEHLAQAKLSAWNQFQLPMAALGFKEMEIQGHWLKFGMFQDSFGFVGILWDSWEFCEWLFSCSDLGSGGLRSNGKCRWAALDWLHWRPLDGQWQKKRQKGDKSKAARLVIFAPALRSQRQCDVVGGRRSRRWRRCLCLSR